ncbi:MAG: bifunctional riboflavin kinase/FAD synthetase [Actinomycetota bacterium]|nr:bifunctional riboflavin kinase/FAD synthetase [Actinomycetota bacterium]
MRRWNQLDEVGGLDAGSVVTIGVFDGVHLGHAALIGRAVATAIERSLPAVVMTFDPHPAAVFAPDRVPPLLTTPIRKAELIAGLGVDALLSLSFTPAFAALSPADFVDGVLHRALRARQVVVGPNFTFGHLAAGTVPDLEGLGAAAGFAVESVGLVTAGAQRVSSTRIRGALAIGDVESVAALQGRPYRADGLVVNGQQRGRALGYPTANLDLPPALAVPADGVYAGRVVRLNRHGATVAAPPLGVGAISVGTNPTFAGQVRTVEAFVLDFDGDLYGDHLGVEFCYRLRGQEKFDSLNALVAQMDADVARARALVSREGRPGW